MEENSTKGGAGQSGARAEKGPPKPERRRLVRNLPSRALFQKIREAERRAEAGERELGFYLLDLQRRGVYRDASCTSFKQFIRLRTGVTRRKAAELLRVQKALDLLPLMDEAFSRGELYWSAVRSMATVATPQNEAQWIEYAKSHRVDEVERRVAASKEPIPVVHLAFGRLQARDALSRRLDDIPRSYRQRRRSSPDGLSLGLGATERLLK